MTNRNKSELDRARRLYDPDDYEEDTTPRNLATWFGLRIRMSRMVALGLGIGVFMIALVCVRWMLADRIPGLPHDTLWFNIVFLLVILTLSFITFSMFHAATNAIRQDIRELDARAARRDNATDEEVAEYVRQSEKKMDRRLIRRWIIILAVIIPMSPLLGTKLVFPWGGVLPYLGGVVVGVAILAVLSWYGPSIMSRLGRPNR